MTATADTLAIRDWIARWFAERGKPLPQAAEGFADVDYLETGLVDSVAMIDLIMDIESRFDIRITSDIMRDPRFSKLPGLAAIIEDATAR